MRPQSIPNPHAIYFQQVQLQSVDPFSETAKKNWYKCSKADLLFFFATKKLFLYSKKNYKPQQRYTRIWHNVSCVALMVNQRCLIMTEVNQLNKAAPDIAKICNCGAKGEIDCKAKAENSMVAKTNQPVDV